MKSRLFKSVLFGWVLLLLFVPILAKKLHIKEGWWLMGSFQEAPDAALTTSQWFSGNYSLIKEKWWQDHFGMRNYYVRLNNQINWDLFRKTQTHHVLAGTDDFMFEYEYIDGYYGQDFVGADSLNRIAFKMKKLQDTLSKLHKLILPVFALGKASFMPENIPVAYKRAPGISNYLYLREKLKHDGVDFIDFNRHFATLKHKSPVPIYPQFGIHWSSYTALLAFDSLVNYLEWKLHENLPDLQRTGFEMSNHMRENDFDIGEALNLLKDPKTFWMGYPHYTAVYDSIKHKKLNLLVVGDSFWFQIYNTKLPDKVFNHRFWFYNEQMYPESHSKPTYVSQVNAAEYIRQADIILILHAEATLNRFGSGFIHSYYRTYFPAGK